MRLNIKITWNSDTISKNEKRHWIEDEKYVVYSQSSDCLAVAECKFGGPLLFPSLPVLVPPHKFRKRKISGPRKDKNSTINVLSPLPQRGLVLAPRTNTNLRIGRNRGVQYRFSSLGLEPRTSYGHNRRKFNPIEWLRLIIWKNFNIMRWNCSNCMIFMSIHETAWKLYG